MRASRVIGAAGIVVVGVIGARSTLQTPAVRTVEERALREYTGVYRWEPDGFIYLQMWKEFTGFDKPSQLVALDESGEVRVLYPTGHDQFFAGPGAALPTSVESRIEFRRDSTGKIVSFVWRRDPPGTRTARSVELERREDVRFSNGGVRLAGTLISPTSTGKRPAIILVHGSGPEDREYLLPFARFLVRRGIAILGYDKRGVGASTGDWNVASFDDLAGDVVAAFEYLKTRSDIDASQIGVLGVSQAGWVMPLAALKARDLAFLISISGAGVTPAETTIDQTRNELTARGMKPQTVSEIVEIMNLQYRFARTGEGWNEYVAAREKLTSRIGPPPDNFPATSDHPLWQSMRRMYFFDPAPTLRQLTLPVLALFGELDNNIVAEKNKAAWQRALEGAGHRDHTLVILPNANHGMLEAKIGSNAEMASLQRFAPAYFITIQDWLAKHVRGVDAGR